MLRGGRSPTARRRSGATCCCAWRPAFETDLGDLERAEEVLRPGAGRAARQDAGGAGVPGSHLRAPGDVRAAGRRPAPAHRHHRRQRASWSPLHLRLGRVLAEALEELDRRDRQLPGGARAGVAHRARRWTRWSACTSAASAGRSCTASTRSWSTSPRTTRRMADCYARMAQARRPTRSTIARRRSSCGARSLDLRGDDPIALSGAGRPARAGGRVARADRGPGEADPRDARSRGPHPAVQAPGPHLGREAVARAQLARELAAGAGDRSAGRRGPARHRRRTTGARAPGRSCRRRCAA